MNPLDVLNSDKVVGIHLTLRDERGKLLETSAERGPMYYLAGTPKLPAGSPGPCWATTPGTSSPAR